jgi:hypothetical protein
MTIDRTHSSSGPSEAEQSVRNDSAGPARRTPMSEEKKTGPVVTSGQIVDQARKFAKASDEVFLSIVRGLGGTALRVLTEAVTVGKAARKAAGVSAGVTQMAFQAARKRMTEIAQKIDKPVEESGSAPEDLLAVRAEGESAPNADGPGPAPADVDKESAVDARPQAEAEDRAANESSEAVAGAADKGSDETGSAE